METQAIEFYMHLVKRKTSRLVERERYMIVSHFTVVVRPIHFQMRVRLHEPVLLPLEHSGAPITRVRLTKRHSSSIVIPRYTGPFHVT